MGGEKMTLRKRGGESEETEDLTVTIQVEAPESSTPRTSKRKRRGGKAITSTPKKSKVITSVALVVEETVETSIAEPAIPDLSEEEEDEETEPLVASRRRSVEPLVVNEPEAESSRTLLRQSWPTCWETWSQRRQSSPNLRLKVMTGRPKASLSTPGRAKNFRADR